MNYSDFSSITFENLRPMIRKGQVYSFDIEYHSYGGSSSWRLFVTIIRRETGFEKILVERSFETENELNSAFLNALKSESPADQLHFKVSDYPFRVLCGVGRYAKLTGIEHESNLEKFISSMNACYKCRALIHTSQQLP